MDDKDDYITVPLKNTFNYFNSKDFDFRDLNSVWYIYDTKQFLFETHHDKKYVYGYVYTHPFHCLDEVTQIQTRVERRHSTPLFTFLLEGYSNKALFDFYAEKSAIK